MRANLFLKKSAVMAAVFSLTAPVWCAGGTPSSNEAISRNQSALAALESSIPGDGAAAAARRLLDVVEASRDADAQAAAGLSLPCLRIVEHQAWMLYDLANKKADARQLSEQLGVVRKAYAECGWSEPAPTSLEEAARAVDAAETMVRRQDELTTGAACSPSYNIPQLTRDLQSGRYDWGETEAIRGNGTGNFYVVRYYQFSSLAAGSSEACAPMAPVEHLFVNDAMKTLRSNGMSCKGWVDEELFMRALMTRSPDLKAQCRTYISAAYRDLSPEEGVEFCDSLVRHVDDPKALCGDMISRGFLSREKLDSCVFDFAGFQGAPAADTCANLNQAASPYPRCQYDTSFARALAAHDEAQCGSNRICHALMSPEGARKGAAEWEAEALDKTCVAMKDRARVLVPSAEFRLSQTEEFLARLKESGSQADAEALRRRIKDLRSLTARLSRDLSPAR